MPASPPRYMEARARQACKKVVGPLQVGKLLGRNNCNAGSEPDAVDDDGNHGGPDTG